MADSEEETFEEQERRLTERLVLYWQNLRDGRKLPVVGNINSDDLEDVWADCFIVEISQDDESTKHNYTYIGDRLAKLFGGDLTGSSVLYITDSLAERYFQAARICAPIIDESCFTNLENQEICYRQIILPFGEDGETVDHVFGGMRYKKVGVESP